MKIKLTKATNVVRIRRKGNLLRIQPISPKVRTILGSELTYTRKRYLATYAEQKANNGRKVALEDVECFELSTIVTGSKKSESRVALCLSGYLDRLTEAFKKNGLRVDYKDYTENVRSDALKPDWKRLHETFDLRPGQEDVLRQILANERGFVHWPTGAGKSFLIQALPILLPSARILLTTKHQAVLLDHFDKLSDILPAVGVHCSKKKKWGSRVMVCSIGCLGKMLDFKPDILIADEVQELATDKCLEVLSAFNAAKYLAVSANYNDRLDGADFELEGIFGRRISVMKYEEGVENNLIVPIEVRWRTLTRSAGVSADAPSYVVNKKGVWFNDHRNRQIAKDAKSFPDDQVLIVVRTIQHAFAIQQHLPDFKVIYSPKDKKSFLEAVRSGVVPEGTKRLTDVGLLNYKRKFEAGKLKKVIATTVWNRGVNFHHLSVLIRADATGNKISATQIPGRLSRLLQGKEKGILIDYTDEFHPSLESRANSRKAAYRKQGWRQVFLQSDGKKQQKLIETD